MTSKLTVKEARRIIQQEFPCDFEHDQATGFLAYHERIQPVVAAAKRVISEGMTESEASAIEGLEEALAQYEKDILGS